MAQSEHKVKTPKQKLSKRILPTTLFGRSMLIIMTPVLLLQLFATYIFYDRHWSRMTDRLAYALVGEVSVIIDRMHYQEFDPQAIDELAELSERYLEILVRFEPEANLPEESLSGWRPQVVAQTLRRVLEEKLPYQVSLHVGDQERWIELAIAIGQRGVLFISVPERRLFSSSSYIFVLWMVGLSVVLFSIAIIFMRNQIRPIRRLAIAADWFGRGKDVSQFKPEGAREVRQAANAFLTMRDRLRRQISQRAIMLAGVSHDLRTPLTRMRLAIEMLDVPKSDKQELGRDIQEMERMVDGYLDFVRGEGEEETEKSDLARLIEDVYRNHPLFDSKHVSFVNEVYGAPVMWLKSNAMRRCLQNLIGNALTYANSRVNITLQNQEDESGVGLCLLIEDDGPGIPEESRDNVFKPFYRLESSRNKQTGGVGLGMSIAMDVVYAHGGKIYLGQSDDLKGLKVSLILPL